MWDNELLDIMYSIWFCRIEVWQSRDMLIFFFAKELQCATDVSDLGESFFKQAAILQNLTNLTKLKYFLSLANHGYAEKGKLFWWDCFFLWYLMAVDLATNADVDYRKDFSETERKLAAGSSIWKVQPRKLLFHHYQLSSMGFCVSTSLGFELHL